MTVDFTKSDSTTSHSFYRWHGFVSQPTYRVIEYFKRWGNPLTPNIFDNCSTRTREITYRLIGPVALAGATAFLAKRASLPQLGLLAAGLVVMGVGRNVLHHLGFAFQERNYIHVRGTAIEAPSANPKIMSWNILGFPAGMNYTCGGCIPFRHRFPEIAKEINAQSPEIVILQECVMDASVTEAFIDQFKDKYAHFFIHNGPNSMGIESGLLVMTKCPVSSYTFTPFETNDWQITRGFVTLTIPAEGNRPAFAIIGTHMEAGSSPEDISKRKLQLAQIHAHAKTLNDVNTVILAGDLNIDASQTTEELDQVLVSENVHGKGYATCTNELNKLRYPDNTAPDEEWIDQIGIVKRDTTPDLELKDPYLLEAYYKVDGKIDSKHALSDHHALVATVNLKA